MAHWCGLRQSKIVVRIEMACLLAAQLRALRRRAQVRVLDVPGGGHHVHMRFAKLIASQIDGFVKN
jgi:hypothetical protein